MENSSSSGRSQALEELTAALQELRRAAGQPSYRQISAAVKSGPYRDAPSHEGVRTAINGLRVPRWSTVESIVGALAGLCRPERDPDAEIARIRPLWRTVREGEAGALKSAREFVLAQSWGEESGSWTPEMVAGVIINPFNAVELAPELIYQHEPLISEEDWVRANLRVIEQSGAEFFLHALLRILKGEYVAGQDTDDDEIGEAFDFACDQIVRRLDTEPNLLARSISAFREDDSVDEETRQQVAEAESDMSLMREVMTISPESWEEVSEEAHWLVYTYLVKEGMTVGNPGLPAEQRFRITWRIPEPSRPT